RFAHGPTRTMGHGTDVAGDAGERRRLAFTPSNMGAGLNANQQGVLAAIGVRGYVRHGEVEKIHCIDFHMLNPPPATCFLRSQWLVGTPATLDSSQRVPS